MKRRKMAKRLRVAQGRMKTKPGLATGIQKWSANSYPSWVGLIWSESYVYESKGSEASRSRSIAANTGN